MMVYPSYFFLLIISLILHPSYCQIDDFNCGDVFIDYPFVLKGTNKSMVIDDFVLTCINGSNAHNYSSNNFKPKTILSKFNLEVVGITVNGSDTNRGHITVKIPVAKSCGVDHNNDTSLDLSGSVFNIDTFENVFASVGCDGKASLYAYTDGHQSISCSSGCDTGSGQEMSVDGSGCDGYYCCQSDIRSLESFQRYTVNVTMTSGNDHKSCRAGFLTTRSYLQLNSSISQAKSAQFAAVPVMLQWQYTNGFVGGFGSVRFNSVEKMHFTLFLISVVPTLAIASCCSGFCWVCIARSKRKKIKFKAKYFKTRLDEKWSSGMDVAKKTTLFRLKDLKEATNNFDKDRILGQGGQGTVYKGILKDGQLIAVKKSRTYDERHWMQFINEVILLSKINHRNVLGCCLGTKAPMLVYEFISNGTLSDYIHKAEQILITWEMRIRIASEVAGAFSYLHSSLSTPIYHRDIKSTNILLDANYRAKVADFGISMVVSIDKTHMTTGVQGTFGYLDPEYYKSSHYSEKSEVYSFGVILVELLTRQHPVRVFTTAAAEEDEDERSLVVYFVSSMNESKLEEILDPIIFQENKMEDVMVVAELAKRCLKPRGMDRPTMKEAAMELEGLWKKTSSSPNANVPQRGASILEIESVPNHESKFQISNHAHTSPILHTEVNSTDGNPRDDEQPLCRVTW